MEISTEKFSWTRQPKSCVITEKAIEVVTQPKTDLWQRTYYHFRNDNAPVFQMETERKYFSFIVKTDFTDSHQRFDQCGIVLYLDSIECSPDGIHFTQMRICHLHKGGGKIRFGIYACSPEDASFKAVFTHMQLTECAWKAHDGQQPDETT